MYQIISELSMFMTYEFGLMIWVLSALGFWREKLDFTAERENPVLQPKKERTIFSI